MLSPNGLLSTSTIPTEVVLRSSIRSIGYRNHSKSTYPFCSRKGYAASSALYSSSISHSPPFYL